MQIFTKFFPRTMATLFVILLSLHTNVNAANTHETEDAALTIDVVSLIDVECFGLSTGAVTVLASGGVPLYTYVWSNGVIGPVNLALSAGVYTVTCTDLLGATATLAVTIDEPDPLEILVLSQVNIDCDHATGSITVGSEGGTGLALYVWSNGQIGPIATNLSAGVYVVTGTDENGCIAVHSITVTADLTLPSVSATVDAEINCLNATVTLDGSGSSVGPDFLYLWTTVDGHILSGANTLNNCVVDEPGTYVLLVTSLLNGCDASDDVVVTADIDLPAVNATVNAEISCLNATVTLDGSGSETGPNILYIWTTVDGHILSGANTLNNCVVDEPGTYVLLVTDLLNGCDSSDAVVVTANIDLPAASASVDLELNCLNANVTLDGTGSALGPNFLYLWTTVDGHIVSGENTLNNAVVDEPGIYVLLVTNLLTGCDSSASVVVTANLSLPDVSASVDAQLNCLNATVTLDGTGSSEGSGILYLWTTVDGHIVSGANTLHPVVDEAGIYVLVVTDLLNGCTASASVEVTVDVDLPVVDIDVAAQLGCQNSTVMLDATASSNGADFLYLWVTLDGHIVSGANTLTPTVNAAGTYTLTITNSINGCTATGSTVVIGIPTIQVSVEDVTNVDCFGGTNGTATVSATEGTAPYTYLWSNGMTTASISGLTAGMYTVTIEDAAGCEATIFIVIGQPAQLLATASATAVSAPGETDGSIDLTVNGGTTGYTYLWSNGMTTADISGLAAGTYSVTITDAHGCSIIITVVVPGGSGGCALTVGVTATSTACGQSTGSATATASNQTGTVTYLWSNGMTTSTVNGLAAGTYTVTATDGNSCAATGSVVVGVLADNTPPTALAQNITVYLNASGSANVTAAMINNGSSDLCGNVTLSIPPTTFDCSDIGNQTVVLTVTDQSGNTATASSTVSVVDSIGPDFDCPANITVTTSGVVNYSLPTFTDNCSVAGTPMLIAGLPSGSMFPTGVTTVIYAMLTPSGIETCSFTVTVTTTVVVVVTVTPPDCPGMNNGSATANVTGCTGPFTYLWMDENGATVGTTATINNLSAGVYTVLVANTAGNCSVMQTFVVTDPTPIDIDIVVISNDCTGTGGSIDLTVTGGTPPYTYTWYNENGQVIATTEDLDSIPSGDYTVEVTDAGGCVSASGVLTVDFLNGIIELQTVQGTIDIFPNPTTAYSTLNIDLAKESEVSVSIYNLQGSLMKTIMDSYFQHSSVQLDLSDLPAGSYLLKTLIDGRPVTRKIVRIVE